MECGVASESTKSSEFTKLTNAFMFTEEQITKQLADMREQTDFMKKFRCALGLALREIKTLRTTASPVAEDGTKTEHMWQCSQPGNASMGTAVSPSSGESAPSIDAKCVCGEFGQEDLQILKEYLSKMTLEDGDLTSTGKSYSFRFKATHNCCNIEKIKESGNLIEDSIRHIERLKQHVIEKNDTIKKLCHQVTQARLIRVKRETKLEQKLKEIKEWKERHHKVKKSNDNLARITKGLRVALNAERQRVESSQNMAHGLEETRRAFQSLKSQAEQLMTLLREKDYEIAELTAKLEQYHEKGSETSHTKLTQQNPDDVDSSDDHFTDTGIQTEAFRCAECSSHTHEVKVLSAKYERLGNAFEDYRKRYPINGDNFQRLPHYPRSVASGVLQNHPYERRKMHAPYVSPDSYRRVSRPPLRRRLQYEARLDATRGVAPSVSSSGENPRGDTAENTLLSPIDEYDETSEPLKNACESGKAAGGVATVQSYPDFQTDLAHENHLAHESKSSGHDHGQRSTCHAAMTKSSPELPTTSRHSAHENKSSRNFHDHESFHVSQYHEDNQSSINFVSSAFSHSGAASSLTGYSKPLPMFDEPIGGVYEQFSRIDEHLTKKMNSKSSHEMPSFVSDHGNSSPSFGDGPQSKRADAPQQLSRNDVLTKQPNCKSNHDLPTNQSPSRRGMSKTSKTSYLELGNSGSSSPSSCINAGQSEDVTQPLCMNSFIRHAAPEESTDTVSEQSSLPMDDLDLQCQDLSGKDDPKEREAAPTPFGVVWHPTLKAESTEYGKAHEKGLGIIVTPHGDDAVFNPLLGRHDVTAHKPRKSKHGGHCVSYKGHKIDVTDFSIHAFREIIWSLDGGPESSDDFIKFLASLAKKLNNNPKWAGRHSMGKPEDWLALTGLY